MMTTATPTAWVVEGAYAWGYITLLSWGDYEGTVVIGPHGVPAHARDGRRCTVSLADGMTTVKYATFDAAEQGVHAMVDRLDALVGQAVGISEGVLAAVRQWKQSTDLRGGQ